MGKFPDKSVLRSFGNEHYGCQRAVGNHPEHDKQQALSRALGRHFQFIRRSNRAVRLPCAGREFAAEPSGSHGLRDHGESHELVRRSKRYFAYEYLRTDTHPREQTAILASSDRLLTPDSLAQAFATRKDYDRVKHLLTLQTNETYDAIPPASRMAEVRSIISTNWPRIPRRARTRDSVQIASRPLSPQISRPLPPAIPVCEACRQTRRNTSGALPPGLLTTLIRTRCRQSSTEGNRPAVIFSRSLPLSPNVKPNRCFQDVAAGIVRTVEWFVGIHESRRWLDHDLNPQRARISR